MWRIKVLRLPINKINNNFFYGPYQIDICLNELMNEIFNIQT